MLHSARVDHRCATTRAKCSSSPANSRCRNSRLTAVQTVAPQRLIARSAVPGPQAVGVGRSRASVYVPSRHQLAHQQAATSKSIQLTLVRSQRLRFFATATTPAPQTAAASPSPTDRAPAASTDKTSTTEPKSDVKWANTWRLMSLAKDEKSSLAIAMVGLSISSATSLVLPAAIGRIIDLITKTSDPTNLGTVTMVLAGVFALGSVAAFVRSVVLTLAGQRIVARLRKQLFESLAKQEVAFFDSWRTGDLVNRLSRDTETMSKSLLENFGHGMLRVIEGVGGLAILFYLAPKLTLTMLAVMPPVFVAAVVFGRNVRKLATQVTDVSAMASSHAEERLGSIRAVKLFAQEARELGTYATKVDEIYDISRKVAIIQGGFYSALFFAVNSSLLAVLYHGATIVLEGGMTAGELTSFLFYALYVGFAFSGIGSFYGELVKALGSSERIFELLDRKPAQVNVDKTLPALDGTVKFEGVSFAYPTRPDQPILAKLDLEIQPGTILAAVGHSGSGKSTLAGLLTRLYDPQGGTITIGGQDISGVDINWLRKNIAIVPQDIILFSGSIRENIAYGNPDATEEEIVEAAKQASAHEFIQSFPDGYNTQVGERGVSLSGGQKQRVAIARALLKNTRILILDESSAFLDVATEYIVQQALEKLVVGRTVLVIAHRMSTIKNAHRIAVLANGGIVENGTFEELMKVEKGYFKQLVEKHDL